MTPSGNIEVLLNEEGAKKVADRLEKLRELAQKVNAALEAAADEIIASKGPGWERLKIVRQRDEALKGLREIEAKGAPDDQRIARQTICKIEAVGKVNG